MKEKEIKAMIVLEMLGRPAEHLETVMNEFLKRLGEEKGVEITDKKIHKPKEIENKNEKGEVIKLESGRELYSSFAEIELQVEEIFNLIKITFDYMPSHIEIISPEEFRMQNFDLGTILTEITRKMHQYDAIAKNALLQNQALAGKLQQMYNLLKSRGIEDKEISFRETPIEQKVEPIEEKKEKKSKKTNK